MNRRQFSQSLAATALSYTRILGANDRVGIGLIGTGRRGREVTAAILRDPRAELRVLCDIYDVQLERAQAALKQSSSAAKILKTHEETLSQRTVDAVIIAAPDHLHLSLATAALQAGKHVYLEKPTVHRWEERVPLAAAAQQSNRILQCGTQQRSGAHYQRAHDELFAQQKLGQVLFARAVWHNFPWQQRHIAATPQPPNFDWQRFLGSAPKVPYEAARYDAWRYYPDYGGGLLADILTHWADVAQWMMNDATPLSASALGGIYGPRDGRQNPDTVNAIIQYKDWNLSFESSVLSIANPRPGVFFQGTAGSLELTRDGYTFTPNNGTPVQVAAEENLEQAHTRNFLDAITSGKPVNAPLAAGIDACRPVQLALRAYWQKKLAVPNDLST